MLRVPLRATKIIESPFSFVRSVMHNPVSREWRPNTNQAARWIASGLLHAEKRMRRIKGYKSMSVLRTILEAEVVRKEQSVDPSEA